MGAPGEFPASLEDRFEVLGLLGQGGFGRVVLARDRQLDRKVAIKIHLMVADVPDAVARFLQEAQVTARVEAPEVVRIYDHGVEPGGEAWIVYEYVQGETLAARLARKVRLPIEVCLDWGRRVARALQLVHDEGVVHRDIKPANLMIRSDGGGEAPVLCDFGLAWTGQGRRLVTQEGLVLGTPSYMPPEVLFGGSPSPAGDQYAWAAVLFEMVYGRKLQPDPNPSSVAESHRSGKGPDFRTRDVEVPPFLVDTLSRALDPDPAHRFASMAELAGALEGRDQRTRVTRRPDLGGAATLALDSRALDSGPRPAIRPRPVRGAAAAGVLALLVASVALGMFWPGEAPSRSPSPSASPAPAAPPAERFARAAAERTLEDLLRFLDEKPFADGPSDAYKNRDYIRARLHLFADPFYGTKFQRYADALVEWAPLANADPEGRVALVLHRSWVDHLTTMYEGAFEVAEVPTDVLQWGPREEILPLISKVIRAWTRQKERLRDLVARLRKAAPDAGVELLHLELVAGIRVVSSEIEPTLQDLLRRAEEAEDAVEGLRVVDLVATFLNQSGSQRLLSCRFRRRVLRVFARRHANAAHAPERLPGVLWPLGDLVFTTFDNCPKELGELELAAVDLVLDQVEAHLGPTFEKPLANFLHFYSLQARPPSNTLAVRLDRVEALRARLEVQAGN